MCENDFHSIEKSWVDFQKDNDEFYMNTLIFVIIYTLLIVLLISYFSFSLKLRPISLN